MTRRQYDAYYTEQGLTLELLKHLSLDKYKTILEPCVGDGHIRNVVQAKYPHLVYTTNDINLIKDADSHYDATYKSDNNQQRSLYQYFDYEGFVRDKWWDCCITNFPYNVQDEILPIVWQHVELLAFIPRLTWLEPTRTRAAFLETNKKHCRYQIIYNPRPKYDSKGSDNVTSMFIVYDKSFYGNPEQIYAVDWQDNKL
jgi:hypothetical protein